MRKLFIIYDFRDLNKFQNNIHNYVNSISGNLFPNYSTTNNKFANLQSHVDNCVNLGGYNTMNKNKLLLIQNKTYDLTIPATIQ